MTVDASELTLSVPEAGRRYFNLGTNKSYEAAARGELPVIRLGKKMRVSVRALEWMLANPGVPWQRMLPLSLLRPPRKPRKQRRLTLAKMLPRDLLQKRKRRKHHLLRSKRKRKARQERRV